MPVGSALLTAGWILLAGGYGRMRAGGRRLALGWLGMVLLTHFAALWEPRLLAVPYWLLLIGGIAIATPASLRPLSLSSLSAAIATVLLVWPGAFENAMDPLLATGLGAALVAVLLSPAGAETGVAVLAAAVGGYVLRSALGDVPAPPPDLEASYQLIGVALVAGYALAALRRRFIPRLWGGAARV